MSQIDAREVYGAYEARQPPFVARLANRATAIGLEQTFDLSPLRKHRPAVRVTRQ